MSDTSLNQRFNFRYVTPIWKGAPSNRLNKRVTGTLKGEGLRKAKNVIDRNGSLNMSGIYGSIEIDERDFVCG